MASPLVYIAMLSVFVMAYALRKAVGNNYAQQISAHYWLSWVKIGRFIAILSFVKRKNTSNIGLAIGMMPHLLYPSNNLVNSLLPFVSDDVPYVIIVACAVIISVSLEDIPECPACILGWKHTVVEEGQRDKTHLATLAASDPASLRTNARRWSMRFQYFSPPLHS